MQSSLMNAFDVPGRRLHWAAFASSGVFALIGVVLMWIALDQSKSWSLAWYYGAHGLLPSVVMLGVAVILRRRHRDRLSRRETLLRSLERETLD